MENWVLFCSIGMELVFAIVTFLVAMYAFKIYKIACQREQKLFALGFLSIALSYLLWFILNLSAINKLNVSTNIFEIKDAIGLFSFGAYAHMILFLAGLSMLVYITLKVENMRPLALIFSISILPLLIGPNAAVIFYAISVIFLLYLASHYFFEYFDNKNSHLITMLISFLLLAVGNFSLIIGIHKYQYYVLGHISSFAAYLLILINLILVLKHGKKKK